MRTILTILEPTISASGLSSQCAFLTEGDFHTDFNELHENFMKLPTGAAPFAVRRKNLAFKKKII
eukprot:SAG22_NODE_191_length_15699_cov_19.660192_17_plen_65_part_00